MSTLTLISLISMCCIYVFGGLNHFINPSFYLKITPKWVPYPEKTNLFVGFIEIALGIGLLFPEIRGYASWGIILLLLAIFPANIYHFQKAKKKGRFTLLTFLRLPLQFVLIYWAYTFTSL